ncbi:hypothetical protein AB1286_26535 [Trinickia sp. NRRL B-1857]|uniref:hypothetical protein n=1 Tax=Trinickia sp. NRRL B-1857 TaxID=3162879 RepID=UPI003D2DDDC5
MSIAVNTNQSPAEWPPLDLHESFSESHRGAHDPSESSSNSLSKIEKELDRIVEELLQLTESELQGNHPSLPGSPQSGRGHGHGHSSAAHGQPHRGASHNHGHSDTPPSSTEHSHTPHDGHGKTEPVGGTSKLPNSTGSYNSGHNPQIDKWSTQINTAAKLTGLDPNLIGGQMWAESRGEAGSGINSKNIDGTTDLSLMQISQQRWEHDVLPTLSAQDKANIKAATGKDPSQLDMHNPADNVIGGAFELRMHIVDAGGKASDPMGNPQALFKGLEAYVGVGDESKYANNVLTNEKVLARGGKLDDNQ